MRLDWENEIEVVKQGTAVTVYLLPNMFVTMGLIVLVVFLGTKMDANLILLLLTAIVSVLAYLCYLIAKRESWSLGKWSSEKSEKDNRVCEWGTERENECLYPALEKEEVKRAGERGTERENECLYPALEKKEVKRAGERGIGRKKEQLYPTQVKQGS